MNINKNIFLLSHYLNIETPAYGGSKSFQRSTLSSHSHGQSSNSEEWTFKNHLGTHIDFPYHFFPDGKTINDFTPDYWFYQKTVLIDCQATENEIIDTNKLEKLNFSDCELLLIRTGFEKFRGKEAFWKNNPGLHPNVASYLKGLIPSLRTIGFDFISLTSYQNRSLGREAHKAFLGQSCELLVIEDMHLSACTKNEFSTIVAPLLVEKADGSPVSVFGFT